MAEFIVMVIALLFGLFGFGLMLASFTLIVLHGNWHRAMARGPSAAWSLARVLMLAGASLGVVFSILILLFARW